MQLRSVAVPNNLGWFSVGPGYNFFYDELTDKVYYHIKYPTCYMFEVKS